LPELLELEQSLARDYCRYSDTVAVSSALHDFFCKHQDVAKFIGIEFSFKNRAGKLVTPDVSAGYNNDRSLLLLELKWSLPQDETLLAKEIAELEKYTVPCLNFRGSGNEIDCQDLVLICHLDDAQRIVDMVKQLSNKHLFLKQDGFAIWAWTIALSKSAQRREEMRLYSVYGKTRNEEIESLVTKPGGILFSEDALTFLRFKFTFIREKPPVQYTMAVLIQNILSSLSREPDKDSQDAHIDMIYERAKAFFPSWHRYDDSTIQVKRRWISEAIETMVALGLCRKVLNKDGWYSFPIPMFHPRKPVQIVLCKKMAKAILKHQHKKKKGGRPKSTFSRPKPSSSDKSLTPFL
jgi:hypothetical protein